ncbi:hypothetical protein D9M73_242000 [compost metagenome]
MLHQFLGYRLAGPQVGDLARGGHAGHLYQVVLDTVVVLVVRLCIAEYHLPGGDHIAGDSRQRHIQPGLGG